MRDYFKAVALICGLFALAALGAMAPFHLPTDSVLAKAGHTPGAICIIDRAKRGAITPLVAPQRNT